MKERLMDRFVLAQNREQFYKVDTLFLRLQRSRDQKVKSELFAEIRSIMQFTDFVGFAETLKAIELWRTISRRKLDAQDRGIVAGTKVQGWWGRRLAVGVVTAVRDDFVLRITAEDGDTLTATPGNVTVVP